MFALYESTIHQNAVQPIETHRDAFPLFFVVSIPSVHSKGNL